MLTFVEEALNGAEQAVDLVVFVVSVRRTTKILDC